MMKTTLIFIAILTLAFSACQQTLPEKSSENYPEAIRSFYVGLAALQVGDDQRAGQELAKAANLADGEPAVWNNLGVLQLRQKDLETAAQSLEKARSLAPNNALIYSNLAVLEIQRGNFEKAIEHLNKTIELDSSNFQVLYALAQEKERQTNDAEAQKIFEKIAESKPENLAAKLEIARLAAKTNQTETLKNVVAEIERSSAAFSTEAKEQFSSLKESIDSGNTRQAATTVSFLRNVLLREPYFRSALAEIKPSDTAFGEVFRNPLKLPVPDFSPAEPDAALTFSTTAVENLKANFAKPIFLGGEDPPVVVWSDGTQTKVGKSDLPVGSENANQIIAFDFDYDFKNDLAAATGKGFHLFKQIDSEKFEDVTANTKLSSEILQKSYSGIWTLDVESDGDLDLVLSDATVLQNNSDGSFSAIRPFQNASEIVQFFSADLDEDGDPDTVHLGPDGKIRYFSNERGGLFKETNSPVAPDVRAIAAGDANGDGRIDLIVLTKGLVQVIAVKNNGELKFESAAKINGDFCSGDSTASKCLLRIGDVDNNGANDILIGDGKTVQILLGGKDGKFAPAAAPVSGNISAMVEFNGDGKLDLIGTDQIGNPAQFLNQSAKNYHWQITKPKAAKTEGDQRVNTFGIGGEIEIRSGLLAQKQLITSPQVHFGLGENPSADVLRVVWGNGYVQAEFDLKPDQTLAAEQRLKGSCPHLFAWNGSEFALVKDAPPWSPALGLKINAQDTYGILQTEEWFKIPGEALKAKDGSYELRITGEYWESFYLDNYKLLAVDHPEDTEIFTDERFSIPLPPLEVFTTETTREFASVKNAKGEDATNIVKNLDENYLDGIERGKFQGVAKEHFIELELPENAPKDKKIWIVGDGWMHPTDASINVQRGQIPGVKPPKSLSLEVLQDNGEWKTVKDNLGFPAGKMKTILIDLPPNGRKFRLSTELEIFWDKLAWAVDLPENQTKENSLDLASAELRYRGFSVIEKRDDSSPEKPVYDKILTTNQRWRDLEGFYTRFGDVLELLAKTDDRIVLMNAGDELILKFAALPDPPKGWKRDFVIIGNGWIKDGDLNSVFSRTLLPLPTHATNDYSKPPARLEDDPVFQKNKTDWLGFHTRYVSPDSFRNALRTK